MYFPLTWKATLTLCKLLHVYWGLFIDLCSVSLVSLSNNVSVPHWSTTLFFMVWGGRWGRLVLTSAEHKILVKVQHTEQCTNHRNKAQWEFRMWITAQCVFSMHNQYSDQETEHYQYPEAPSDHYTPESNHYLGLTLTSNSILAVPTLKIWVLLHFYCDISQTRSSFNFWSCHTACEHTTGWDISLPLLGQGYYPGSSNDLVRRERLVL